MSPGLSFMNSNYTAPIPPSNKPVTAPPVVNANRAQAKVKEITEQLNTPQDINQKTQVLQPQQDTTLDDYEKEIGGVNSSLDAAYNNYQQTIKNIQNGTIPLTAGEQSLLSNLQNSFARQKIAQEQANRAYTMGVTVQGFRSGTAQYSPVIAQQQIQQSITEGLNKIQDIDSQAALKINEVREAMLDKKYKLAKESYDEYSTLLKDKRDTISDLYTKTVDHERDLRNYNLEVQKFEEQKKENALQAEKTRLEMKKISNELAMGANIDPNGAQGVALQNAAKEFKATGKMPTWLNKDQKQYVALLATSMELPEGQLVSATSGGPPVGLSQQRLDAITALKDVKDKLSTLDALFGDMNTGLSGVIGKLSPSESSVAYSSLRQQILNNLLKAYSGAAVSDQEYARYTKLVPKVSNQFLFLGADGAKKIKALSEGVTGTLDTQLKTNGLKFMTSDELSGISDEDLMMGALGGETAGMSPEDFFNNLYQQLD